MATVMNLICMWCSVIAPINQGGVKSGIYCSHFLSHVGAKVEVYRQRMEWCFNECCPGGRG